MKKLFIDIKTTGLDHRQHGIIELSAIAEIDHKIVDQIHLEFRPFMADTICPNEKEILLIRGITEEMLRSKERLAPKKAFVELTTFLDAHVDKFNKDDNFTLYGHNVGFHLDFFSAFFTKNECRYLGSYINFRPVCTLAMSRYLNSINASRITEARSLSLHSLCKAFNIKPVGSISAKNDVEYLYQMWKQLEPYFIERIKEL